MMTATRREWNELYVFFALLGQGSIALGDAEGKASPRVLPIARISRQEHDGKRDYLVENTMRSNDYSEWQTGVVGEASYTTYGFGMRFTSKR